MTAHHQAMKKISNMSATMEFIRNLQKDRSSEGWVHSVFILYFIIFTLSLFFYAVFKPIHNWDLVAYAGSVKSFETSDKQVISDYAYGELKKYADAETWEALTNGSEYRRNLYADPESFNQVLPWYQIRPVYTGLMYALNKMGMNIFDAGHMISAVSVVIGIWVFFYAFNDQIGRTLWFSVPFFILLNGVVEVARIGTPDGLAFLYTGILSALFLRQSRSILWLLPLAVILRTDMIFLVGLMLGYLFLRHKSYRIPSIISLLATVAIYLFINKYFNNYGWATVFYLVFITDMHLNYPADTEISISVSQYLMSLARGTIEILINDGFDVFMGLFAIQLGISFKVTGFKQSVINYFMYPVNALAVISFVYVIVHFLVFPAGYSRFFAAQYLTILLTLLTVINRINTIHPEPESVKSD